MPDIAMAQTSLPCASPVLSPVLRWVLAMLPPHQEDLAVCASVACASHWPALPRDGSKQNLLVSRRQALLFPSHSGLIQNGGNRHESLWNSLIQSHS